MSGVERQHVAAVVAVILLLANLVTSAQCAMAVRDLSSELKIFRESQITADLESMQKLKAVESWVNAHATAAIDRKLPLAAE
jgi:hypothetical protein